ncbi:sulfotransferase family 2 domain-containing protein [Winogradskyella sp. HB-48]|uniref:sulfotransferase family 2 domain-containing protein n=1 Tax=Winogradskyella sp. HB-48 TaxID=3416808 RepID=UPI003CEDE753
MISHAHKCIFIHIPKTAGSSINSFFHPDVKFHFKNADYDRLFGWCPKRKLHMQHATASQLLETELISEEIWNTYYKFTFVRNPWDRSYSDYLWMKQFANIKDSFKNYMRQAGDFTTILNDNTKDTFLGDHILGQHKFFDLKGPLEVDFLGRFENFSNDIQTVLKTVGINRQFNKNLNKSKRKFNHYSRFYSNSNRDLVLEKYRKDIELFGYDFEDKRTGLYKLKSLL